MRGEKTRAVGAIATRFASLGNEGVAVRSESATEREREREEGRRERAMSGDRGGCERNRRSAHQRAMRAFYVYIG